MIESISSYLLNYIIKKQAIDGERDDIVAYYKYGIEITISSIFNIVLVLLISLVMRRIPEGIIFLMVFIPARQFIGGYHADSYFACNMTIITCFVITLLLYNWLHQILATNIIIIALVIELIFIIIVSPIKNRHKPIRSNKQYYICKIIGSVLYTVWAIIGVSPLSFWNNRNYMIILTLNLITILGIIGIIKERRLDNNEKEQCS